MLGKKGEDKKSSKEEELIKRVDAMLDPKATDKPTPNPSIATKPETVPPPLDIFKDAKTAPVAPTAPEIPGKTIEPQAKKIPLDKPTVAVKRPASPEPVKDESVVTAQETAPEPLAIDESNPKIENAATDKAVADIVAKEGDALLAAQDATQQTSTASMPTEKAGFKAQLKRILKSKITWVLVALIVIVLFAVPQTRYAILGLLIKKQVTIEVYDSKTKTPVSNAQVQIDGDTVKTDPEGKAEVTAGVGPKSVNVSKQYYATNNTSLFVGLNGQTNQDVQLNATGRQVPISIVNSITKKPVADAEIQVLNTSAKTDKKGQATIVLPTNSNTEQAIIKIKGYNDKKVEVTITNEVISQNAFQITPVGKVYYLSNQSGKIDVISSNLDGSDREIVLEGTGKEEANNTNLLASRDWKYVMLKSRRDNAQPALYLIDTSTNKVTQVDSSNAGFNLIGWYGHSFMYSSTNNASTQFQNGRQTIKSYDAEKAKLNQLDQTQAEGNPNTYGYQTFNNFHIVNNLLTYSVQWNAYDVTGAGFSLAGKNDAIRGVQLNGQNKKNYQTFPSAGAGYVQSVQVGPQTIYYSVPNTDTGQTTYYQFDNQTVTTVNNIDRGDLERQYPTYLVSPSGSQALWSDVRDGKYTLFLGDSNGKNPKQIPSSTGDFAPYGWFSDDSILVTKDNNQLFIMPVAGLGATQQPLKVSNYYKPAASFTGYGYGYGGL